MPLVARLDDETVVSVDLTDERWALIHKPKQPAGLICAHCDGKMIAKQRMIRFFAHRTLSPDCPAGRESEAHIQLKLALRNAAAAAGWDAALEFASARLGTQHGTDRWVADVLATSPDRQPVALEAQLASQSIVEAQERTDRYGRNGIDVIWFARRRRSWALVVPAVAVSPDNRTISNGLYRANDTETALVATETTLNNFIRAYLKDQVTTTTWAGNTGFISKVGLARFTTAQAERDAAFEARRKARAAEWTGGSRRRVADDALYGYGDSDSPGGAHSVQATDRREVNHPGEIQEPLHETSALLMKALQSAGFTLTSRAHHGPVYLLRMRAEAAIVVAVGGHHSAADFVIHVSERPPPALPPGEGWTDPEVRRFALGSPTVVRAIGASDLKKLMWRT